jgi:hypothetical protein
MRITIALVALSLFSLPMPTAAAPTAPTGRWIVNFDDAQCVASRAYGEDQLFLKASPLGDVVQFGVMQPGRSGPPQQVSAEIRPASGASFGGNVVMWTAGNPPQRLRLINMPGGEFERLAASPTLALKIGELRREFTIPAMPQLAKVMKECVDDLQKVWSSEGGVAVVAVANLASFFSDGDYPEAAIRAGLSGTTAFALLIDEKGKVAELYGDPDQRPSQPQRPKLRGSEAPGEVYACQGSCGQADQGPGQWPDCVAHPLGSSICTAAPCR